MEAPAARRINSTHPKVQRGPDTPYHQNLRTPKLTPDRSYQGSNTHPSEERVPAPNLPSPSYQSPEESHRLKQRGADRHRAPPSQSFSASHSVDSFTDKGANAKLPHGLTVHELKEMTKARLEAEAYHRGDVAFSSVRHGPVPSTVRVSADYRDPLGGLFPPSPVPPHSNGRHSARSPYPVDLTTEAWESASVSTNASDYPGSESVYSLGLNGNASFNGDEIIPFSRSASYPSNPGWNGKNDWPRENRPPACIAAPSAYYEGSVYAPNRLRAATLSPRSGLSYVHEDRPVLPGRMPCIPSDFSPPSLRQQRLMPSNRSRSAFIPETLNYGRTQGPYLTNGVIGNSAVNIELSRPRTLSAVSLPSISHTAEELFVENRGTSARFSSQFGSVREDDAMDSVAGLSDVFRGSPMGVSESAAFIGFGSTNSSIGQGSSMDSFETMRMRASTDFVGTSGLGNSFGLRTIPLEDPRHRAATWGEPSLDIFCGHDLSDDLASILKLSGAEQKEESP